MTRKFKLEEFGYEVELGKFACQADGAAWFKSGGTVILSTVVFSEVKDFPGFLPLTVDYRELLSAAGKIPGGYYKREGKFTDKEVLTARLIDRSIRPLFPADFFDQIQILNTVYSVDKKNIPSAMSLVATSIALSVSKIPFLGPIGAVEVGKLNDEWIISPDYEQSLNLDAKLVIAAAETGICMVEGALKEVKEKELVDVFFWAFEKIKPQITWQKEIQKELAIKKEYPEDKFNLNLWHEKARLFLTEANVKKIFKSDKILRETEQAKLKERFFEQYEENVEEVPQSILDYSFNTILKEKVTDLIFKEGKRVDGRKFDQVRNISSEIGLLPCTHGSALFSRGRTQALASVTLGSGQDVKRTEELLGESEDGTFMLHYNFPPFAVGEVRPMRGPSRREVGHGYLAASALKSILPFEDKFPYTIRLVIDILESDGSSSMATVCSSTMALMDAAVPIKDMVGGVAMGLLKDSSDKFQTLTDIAGFEDAFGLMDFKVAGTEKGITAIQMDIKYKSGLKKEIFEAALAQARNGRLAILSEMKKVIDKPKKDMSILVPRVKILKIDPDRIGGIIGTGGKVIKEIIEKTGAEIDIEDDGSVKVFGHLGEGFDKAINWIKVLAGEIEKGAVFNGIIKKVADFGIFIEIAPGKDGLLHISNIPKEKKAHLQSNFKINDTIRVKVVDYDPNSGRISLKLAE